jgi:hypothetical protein
MQSALRYECNGQTKIFFRQEREEVKKENAGVVEAERKINRRKG